jgi:hypothetical protein
MRELPQAFWDELDETPQRRAGGYIVSVKARSERPESRMADLEHRSRFPRREARARYLELLGYLIEKEDRLGS